MVSISLEWRCFFYRGCVHLYRSGTTPWGIGSGWSWLLYIHWRSFLLCSSRFLYNYCRHSTINSLKPSLETYYFFSPLDLKVPVSFVVCLLVNFSTIKFEALIYDIVCIFIFLLKYTFSSKFQNLYTIIAYLCASLHLSPSPLPLLLKMAFQIEMPAWPHQWGKEMGALDLHLSRDIFRYCWFSLL